MVTYDKMSPEEEAQYNYPEETQEDPGAESEEEMVQRLQAAGYTVNREPQTPLQTMLPQPKAEPKVGKGVVRQWAKKEYQDIKTYVKQKASEKMAEREAFKALPPEQQKAIRAEKMARIKGFFSEQGEDSSQSQVQAGVMGQAVPKQQGPSMNMSMIMGDMFGTNQAPTQMMAVPSQRQARRSIPPARPSPTANLYGGAVSAEPRYNTQQVIGNLFGEQASMVPRKGRASRPGMRVDNQGYGMYGAGATDMINRSFSFGPPPTQMRVGKVVRHSKTRHSRKRR